jgi:hypothetical protein
MGERYTSTEAMEHVEKTHGLLERSEHALLRHVPLVAAALAVLAGLSSLLSARTGEAMLASRTEAVLSQSLATDAWNEYQADSLKAHLNESLVEMAATEATRRTLSTDAAKYRSRQGPLRTKATANERQRDDDMRRSDVLEHRKQLFDVAVALFEISIVLTSVAAMVRRQSLFVFSAVVAVAAVAFDIVAFLQ